MMPEDDIVILAAATRGRLFVALAQHTGTLAGQVVTFTVPSST